MDVTFSAPILAAAASPLENPAILIAGGIAVVIVIVVVVALLFRSNDDSIIDERIDELAREADRFEPLEVHQGQSDDDYSETLTSSSSALEEGRRMLNPLNNFLAEQNFGQKWRRNLARADIKLTVAEFAVAQILSAGAFFLLGAFVLFSGNFALALLAAVIGFFVPRILVSRQINKRLQAFEDQLPDTLSLWVNALRSGYSVMQAMEAIARDSPEPTHTEFDRVVREVQLGITMPDALDHLLERVASEDLDLVITAVTINREVGGNLAEILEVISHTIRERIKLKGEIRVLTSQGRITGYVISFLPIILALFLYVISPNYMGRMFENQACGWPMLGAGLALIGIGTAVVQKIVDIDI